MNHLEKLAKNATGEYVAEAQRQRADIMEWYKSEGALLNEPLKYGKTPFKPTQWLNVANATTTSVMLDATNSGLGSAHVIASVQDTSEYFMGLSVDGVTLAESLRDSAKNAEILARETINNHIKAKTTVHRTAKELTARNVSKGDLPKYLKELESAVKEASGNTAKVRSLLRGARKKVDLLNQRGTTKQLQAAYKRVIKAVEKGDTVALNKALSNALDKKAVYNNTRIARSELSRANSMAFARQVVDHPDFADGNVYIRQLLSSAHTVPDLCDYHALADLHDLGEGVTPVDEAPMNPLHSNCMCSQEIVVEYDVDKRKHQFSKEREDEYYKKMSPELRGKIERSKKSSTVLKLKPLPKRLIASV
ncbi:MAG: hypothetical protein GY774_00385 [Planctomycetes bacterium]|nr:hypothetical protein [Planctomycetota bacterium]